MKAIEQANKNGEILPFQLPHGSTHDLGAVSFVVKNLFGDKGYLSKKTFEKFYQKGIKLVTRIRSKYEE